MKKPTASRHLGFELLENRELLSVAPLTYLPTQDYHDSNWFEQIEKNQPNTDTLETAGVVENEWIIRLKEESLRQLYSVTAAAEYLDDYGVTVIGGLGAAGTLHVRMEGGTAEQQQEILTGLDCIESWSQNYTVTTAAVADEVNDPDVMRQWYLDQINVLPAWEKTRGEGVVIAVIDTGIQLDHRDLRENIWVNPGEIAGNGFDDEGNGLIDDVNGWNSRLGNNDVYDSVDEGHGTKVSSVIACAGNNATDSIGIAHEATILPIRAGDSTGFRVHDILEGINYAIMLKTEYGVNIRAINLSISQVHADSIYTPYFEAADKAGIMIVVSSGNDGSDNDLLLGSQGVVINSGNDAENPDQLFSLESGTIGGRPVQYNNQFDNVIVVAATDRNDSLSSFSNYGGISVDLAAPGDGIWVPNMEGFNAGEGGFSTWGTSMAAPMVTSAVALLAAVHPDWSPAQIKEAILATVDVFPSLEGKVSTGGRLNVGNAVNFDPTVYDRAPETPSVLFVKERPDHSLQLSWKDNSRNENRFELQYSRDNGQTWVAADNAIEENTDWTIFAPTVLGQYQFRVRASNRFGDSSWSASATIQVGTLPNPLLPPLKDLEAPTGCYAQVHVDGSFILSWDDNSSCETAFEIQYRHDHGEWTTADIVVSDKETTTMSFSSGGLYEFRVRAVYESIFASDWSSTFSVTKDVFDPSKGPTGLNASTIDEFIALSWTTVFESTAYRLERSLSGRNDWTVVYEGTENRFDDKNVVPDTSYDYRVYAVSGNVVSQAGEAITQMSPPEDATKPTRVVAVAESDKIVSLSWKAVQGANSYIIERSTDGTTWRKVATVKNATTYQNKSLTAATTYYYRISSSGLSVTTSASDVVTVRTKLAGSIVPTLKVTSSRIGIVDVGDITIVPTRTTPSDGLYYYIEYTSAVDAKRKPDWSQAIIEKVSGPTHLLQTTLNQNTQYYARMVATETNYALTDLPAWDTLSNIGIGKEAKFKTKATPLAKITTSGYAMSGGEFGVKLRITNPQQNDNARNPLLPDGTTFSHQLIVADDKAKADKATGILATGTFEPLSLGNVTFTETMVKSKKYFDSPVILFSDIARLGDVTKMNNVQFQLLVTYTMPDGVVTTAASKCVKLALPKWFT